MPLAKGSQNVPLRPKVVARLKERYDSKRKTNPVSVPLKFGAFVNDLMELYLDKDEFMQKMMPQMSLAGQGDNVLFIKDFRKGRTAEVYLKDQELYCEMDRSQDCEHIHFTLGLPEVARLTFKRPK